MKLSAVVAYTLTFAAALSIKTAPVDPKNSTIAAASKLGAQVKMVAVGPFTNNVEACTYCFTSFTKTDITPDCICAAYTDGGEATMLCSSHSAGMGFVKEKGGCVCNEKNMQDMGEVTCDPIE
jgi:hypothetical protein